jgi:vacuolar-type H+-ATPase subunit F/Vma7
VSAVVAIGERAQLEGYALAGVEVIDAGDGSAVQRAWDELPADVRLVLLSPAAHAALAAQLSQRPLLWLVVPE